MTISKATAIFQEELTPIKKKNAFGMTIVHKMNKLTIPKQTLLQDVTKANTNMIESVPVALSFQSMMETRRASHEYKINPHTIPTWKCIIFGKERETRIYEVFKVLRHWMRLQWILDLNVEFEELEEGKTYICAWMLSVRKLPSFGHRHSMLFDPLVFEGIGNRNIEHVPVEQTVLENYTEEQGVPMADTNQIKIEHELSDKSEENETPVGDTNPIMMDQPEELETPGTETNQIKVERETV